MEKLKELCIAYSKKFNESFPIFMVMGMSDEEIEKIIKDSIETGIKYKPKVVKDAVY